jgi:hypothetical protein
LKCACTTLIFKVVGARNAHFFKGVCTNALVYIVALVQTPLKIRVFAPTPPERRAAEVLG